MPSIAKTTMMRRSTPDIKQSSNQAITQSRNQAITMPSIAKTTMMRRSTPDIASTSTLMLDAVCHVDAGHVAQAGRSREGAV
eukprot:4399192-Prymnesium_polylepis.1